MACFSRQYLARIYPENIGYAKREYGVTDTELDAFVKRMDAELRRARKAGRMTKYKGDLHVAIRD